MKNKRVLIIGGGGYVGTRLSLHLAELGYQVTVFDTFWFGDFIENGSLIKKIDIKNNRKIKDAVAR